MTDWTLCNWRVRSEIALLECLPWAGPDGHPVDVTVRFGDVPERLPGAVYSEPMTELGENGQYHLSVPDVGRYLARDGREVIVEPLGEPDRPDLRLFVQTSCLAALALQRGLASLHGAVARISGKTIAVLGTSGQGKSTLMAALGQHGHGLMSEDVCVLDFGDKSDDRPVVVPSLPNIRLWHDSAEHLGIDRSELVVSRLGMRKYHLMRPDWFHEGVEPLDAVVMMSEASPPLVPEGLHPAYGAAPVGAICQYMHRPHLAKQLGLQPKMVAMAMRMVKGRRVFNLGTVRDMARLSDVVDELEAMAAGLHP